MKAATPVAKSQKLPAEDSSSLAPLAFTDMLQSFRSLEPQKTAAAYKTSDGTQNLFILEGRGDFSVFNPVAQGKQINPQRAETATFIKIPMPPPANLSHVRALESGASRPSAENIQTQASVHQSVGSLPDHGLIGQPGPSWHESDPISGVTMRSPQISTLAFFNEPIAMVSGIAPESWPVPLIVFEPQSLPGQGRANGNAGKSDSSASRSAGAKQGSSELPLPLQGNPNAPKGKEAAGIRQSGTGRGFIGQATMGIVQGPFESKTKKDAAATSKGGAAASAQSPSSAKVSFKSGATVAVASEKMVPIMNREAKIVGEVVHHQAPPLPSRLEYLRNLSQLAEKIKACAQLRQGLDTVLEFQMTPPRLGSLMLRVQTEGQEMRLYFGAEQEGALQMLKEMRADLTQIAAEQGYDLERCEVEHHPMPDHRPPTEGALWTDRQRSSRPVGVPSNACTMGISEEIIEESPRMLDFGYNTFDLVA